LFVPVFNEKTNGLNRKLSYNIDHQSRKYILVISRFMLSEVRPSFEVSEKDGFLIVGGLIVLVLFPCWSTKKKIHLPCFL